MQEQRNRQRRVLMKMFATVPLMVSLDLHGIDSVGANNRADEAFINSVAEILIPGAIITRPGKELMTLLPSGWLGVSASVIKTVQDALNNYAGGAFIACSPLKQQQYLSAFDSDSYTQPALSEAEAWFSLKNALLSLFFSSEQGASRTLAYHPVPGRWRPDIPVNQATPSMYNDWLAVWFT